MRKWNDTGGSNGRLKDGYAHPTPYDAVELNLQNGIRLKGFWSGNSWHRQDGKTLTSVMQWRALETHSVQV